ncbi:collagen, type I, alpha 1b-like [Oryctolagus cuniculus]|uniref:collagen, type I, alpha 1b-like n=1 Tax=Oryctolagus cuniculus TaxID=9986 RepID=UPI003879685D
MPPRRLRRPVQGGIRARANPRNPASLKARPPSLLTAPSRAGPGHALSSHASSTLGLPPSSVLSLLARVPVRSPLQPLTWATSRARPRDPAGSLSSPFHGTGYPRGKVRPPLPSPTLLGPGSQAETAAAGEASAAPRPPPRLGTFRSHTGILPGIRCSRLSWDSPGSLNRSGVRCQHRARRCPSPHGTSAAGAGGGSGGACVHGAITALGPGAEPPPDTTALTAPGDSRCRAGPPLPAPSPLASGWTGRGKRIRSAAAAKSEPHVQFVEVRGQMSKPVPCGRPAGQPQGARQRGAPGQVQWVGQPSLLRCRGGRRHLSGTTPGSAPGPVACPGGVAWFRSRRWVTEEVPLPCLVSPHLQGTVQAATRRQKQSLRGRQQSQAGEPPGAGPGRPPLLSRGRRDPRALAVPGISGQFPLVGTLVPPPDSSSVVRLSQVPGQTPQLKAGRARHCWPRAPAWTERAGLRQARWPLRAPSAFLDHESAVTQRGCTHPGGPATDSSLRGGSAGARLGGSRPGGGGAGHGARQTHGCRDTRARERANLARSLTVSQLRRAGVSLRRERERAQRPRRGLAVFLCSRGRTRQKLRARGEGGRRGGRAAVQAPEPLPEQKPRSHAEEDAAQ